MISARRVGHPRAGARRARGPMPGAPVRGRGWTHGHSHAPAPATPAEHDVRSLGAVVVSAVVLVALLVGAAGRPRLGRRPRRLGASSGSEAGRQYAYGKPDQSGSRRSRNASRPSTASSVMYASRVASPGEHLLPGQAVVRQVERELEHPDRLRRLGRDDPRVLQPGLLDLRVVDDVVHRAPRERLLRRVLAGEEEDLAGPLLAHLPGQQRRAVAAVERADVGVGLHEARVLAAGDR